jgi:hypothetical protein
MTVAGSLGGARISEQAWHNSFTGHGRQLSQSEP